MMCGPRRTSRAQLQLTAGGSFAVAGVAVQDAQGVDACYVNAERAMLGARCRAWQSAAQRGAA